MLTNEIVQIVFQTHDMVDRLASCGDLAELNALNDTIKSNLDSIYSFREWQCQRT